MSDTTRNGLCSTCVNSIWCDTWGEWKCTVRKRRFYGSNIPDECKSYKKRGKDFKERPCQCEDCLKNPEVVMEEAQNV